MRKDKKRMLISGVSGLLGNNLAFYFKDQYDIVGLFNSHPINIQGIHTEKCDLNQSDHIVKIFSKYKPHFFIHCASLTDIDECEKDKNKTKQINVFATKQIVQKIQIQNLKLIYISTDSVYDGARGNYSEEDDTGPQNYYGLSKYEGELEVLKKENSLVLRTNIFGWNILEKNSLGEWILENLNAGKCINGFQDAYFSTIYTFELARIIDISINRGLSGLYNCGSINNCSKYEFALKIADIFGLDNTCINPISIDEYNFKATRGKKLTLNVNKIQKSLHYRMPTIEHSIEVFYRDFKCGLPAEIRKNASETGAASEMIPYGRQSIDEEDIREVINALRSERITQGPKIEEFENALASYCGAKFAVAVNSGTSALHISCLSAGIKAGAEVITSPNTFIASANCVVYCNAKPVFADIDSQSYNISPKEIEKKVNERTRAVIPVHFAGQSCDMEAISKIVKNAEEKYGYRILIIEDASHALGSFYKGEKVGSCFNSDMAIMSFHPVKHITTGEGGVVLTNDEALYNKLKRFRSHGITNIPDEFINTREAYWYESKINPWYYEQIALGYNYRITDIQSALGLSQLKKLSVFRERRRKIIDRYNDAFQDIPHITIPFESDDCESNFHLYVLLFDFDKIGIQRAQLMEQLRNRGIQTQVHYIPVHMQPYYRRRFFTHYGDCPHAEEYYRKCLSMPLYPAMSDQEVSKVINVTTSLIHEAIMHNSDRIRDAAGSG